MKIAELLPLKFSNSLEEFNPHLQLELSTQMPATATLNHRPQLQLNRTVLRNPWLVRICSVLNNSDRSRGTAMCFLMVICSLAVFFPTCKHRNKTLFYHNIYIISNGTYSPEQTVQTQVRLQGHSMPCKPKLILKWSPISSLIICIAD